MPNSRMLVPDALPKNFPCQDPLALTDQQQMKLPVGTKVTKLKPSGIRCSSSDSTTRFDGDDDVADLKLVFESIQLFSIYTNLSFYRVKKSQKFSIFIQISRQSRAIHVSIFFLLKIKTNVIFIHSESVIPTLQPQQDVIKRIQGFDDVGLIDVYPIDAGNIVLPSTSKSTTEN